MAEQQPQREELLQVVEEAGFEDFGFLVIRTQYGDEELFQKWDEHFNALIEISLANRPGTEDIIDRLMLATVDDPPQLHNASWKKVQEYVPVLTLPCGNIGVITWSVLILVLTLPSSFFEEAQEDNMVPPGLDVGFCIAVDHDAMNSLIHTKEGEDPWVWAVDTAFDFDAAPAQEGEYPGYFKVAVTSVIPEFFPVVAKDTMSGPEVWSFAKPLWKYAA